MGKYIIKRVLWMIPTLLGVVFIIFVINELTPGDAALMSLGTNYTEEAYAAKVVELGLDKPVMIRFVQYVKNIICGFNLGTSYSTLRSVRTMLMERIGVTVQIGVLGSLITILVGVSVGIISAIRQYSALDYVVTTISILLSALPGFFLALVFVMLFSLQLGWLPASGLSTWKHYIMPVVCLGLSPISIVIRMTRSSMLDVIRADYIRTCRAKGLSDRTIIIRHALRNALIPIITIVGAQLCMIFSGSVIIETVFSIPGMGMLMMTAINNRDYPVIQGSVLLLSIVICVVNLLVDLAYAAVDPRIRVEFSKGGAG